MSVNSVNRGLSLSNVNGSLTASRCLQLGMKVAKRLNAIAIPALALLALTYIQGASAGPITYASCMAGCSAMGPFAPACWAACIPFLAAPTP